MTDHTSKTMADLLAVMPEKSFLQNRDKTESFITENKTALDLPVPIRILTAIGAFVASFFLIGLINLLFAQAYNSYTYLLIWGMIFILAALGINQIVKDQNSGLHSFLLQSSLAFMASGKMMLAAGVLLINEQSNADFSGWYVTYTLIAVTLLTYPLYHITVGRFLAVLAICLSILINLFFTGKNFHLNEIGFNIFFLAQIAGTALLFAHDKSKNSLMPIAYALITSLCFCVLFVASQNILRHTTGMNELIANSVIINSILTAALIAVNLWAFGFFKTLDHSILKNEAVIAAILGAGLLGYISIPALLFALILMIFGYARHDKILLVLGILITPYALWLYYYNLDITLMQKSGILIGSGVLLLAGYGYISYRGWNKSLPISHKDSE